jgi:xanthosine utilization system XapX-like protein
MAKRKLPASMKKQKMTPIWIIIGLVVVVIGIFAYRGVRQLSGNPLYLSQDDVPRVTGEEAARAVREQGAILLDTRTDGQFEMSHVEGAIKLPLAELSEVMKTLDKDAWYITYCT